MFFHIKCVPFLAAEAAPLTAVRKPQLYKATVSRGQSADVRSSGQPQLCNRSHLCAHKLGLMDKEAEQAVRGSGGVQLLSFSLLPVGLPHCRPCEDARARFHQRSSGYISNCPQRRSANRPPRCAQFSPQLGHISICQHVSPLITVAQIHKSSEYLKKRGVRFSQKALADVFMRIKYFNF